MTRRNLAAAAGLTVASLLALLVSSTAAGADPAAPTKPAAAVSITTAEASRESQLVAAEDRRLQDIRTVSTLARWQNRAQRAPYRVSSSSGYTLVLTARSDPYQLSDLVSLAPQTLIRLSDKSYLLNENLVVLSGAELDLNSPNLVFRLASSPQGFVSIVSMGGRLRIGGTAQHPVQITSWDASLARNDSVTDDGRAYVRAVGGQVMMSYAELDDLGFWSGRTGGLALTGTDRPNTGSLDLKAAKAATGTGSVGGIQILPTGSLPKGSTTSSDADVYSNTFVAARIDHTVVHRNAFGLFASGADGVVIDESQFLDSQITGVDFHRYVTGSTIQRTVSNGSGGNGFSLGRATQGVQITQSTAAGNAADGFVISGEPLADGPSAVGSPTTPYGNNLVLNSTASHNGHYGIYVKNGFNMTVSGNKVSGSVMGIVAGENSRNVSVNGNTIGGIRMHGVALLDGVKSSSVTGNVLTGSPIYLRDSQAKIVGNSVLGATGHGVSVVGNAGGTVVSNNVASGSGSSAYDFTRAGGTITAQNNGDSGWHDTTSIFVSFLHRALQPTSLLWAAILVLVVVSIIKGFRRRHVPPGTNPYAHQSAHLATANA